MLTQGAHITKGVIQRGPEYIVSTLIMNIFAI